MPAIDHHRPVRSCIGCRQARPQPELVRVTRMVDDGSSAMPGRGSVVVDGPSSGRGAWLCRDTLDACTDTAIARRQFERSWRTSLGDEDLQAIREALHQEFGAHDDDEEDTR